MDTNKTRRAAVGIFGTAAVAALAEIKNAGATKGGHCRYEGDNCSGNQECCGGTVCTPTGRGNSKTCEYPEEEPEEPTCDHDNDCDSDCECVNGGCYPEVEYASCLKINQSKQEQVCETRFGRRQQKNCNQFPNRDGRLRCIRRNRRLRRQLISCRTSSETYAYEKCEYLRVS